MNAESLKIFLDEAASSLPDMRQGIIDCERDPSRIDRLQASRRQAHLIKGAALALDLEEIGEIAGEIEIDLKNLVQTKTPLTETITAAFLSQILLLENVLKDLGAGLTNSAQSETGNNATTSESSAEDFEIDAEMLEVFSLEAEDLLRNINESLEVLEKTPDNREALLEIRRSAHTLKGAAGIIGLKKLSALAHRIEDLLDYLDESEIAGSKRIFELLLNSTDCLSALAAGENSPQLNQTIDRLYQNFEAIPAFITAEKLSAVSDSDLIAPTATQEEIAPSAQEVRVESASAETAENQISSAVASPNRTVIRVSLERLNALFNLAGEMVITRSVFEERLNEMRRQIEELHHTTRRLRASTDKLETDFESRLTASFGSRTYNFPTEQNNPLTVFETPDFDALEFDRYTEYHQTTGELVETASDAAAVNSGLDILLDNLNVLYDSQRRLIDGMQENLLRLRMVSLSSLAPRLQRTVRVTTQEEEKSVDFVLENDALEIDAEILDSIVDPLLHILRNAVAHGIEPPETRRLLGKPEKGKITLRAFSEGTHIVFIVTDDGRGISPFELKEKAIQAGFISAREAHAMSDEAAYSLIFLAGLSTAQKINQVSGRGVGMNVVKTSISRRQGTISVKSEAQKGTSFTIRIPAALAVTRSLLVKAGTQTFAVPLSLVKHITEISRQEFEAAQASKILSIGNASYSFSHFNELLNLPVTATPPDAKIQVVVLKNLETPSALATDRIIKTEEIVIKPLGTVVKNFPQFTGATILGDGSVVAVLDLVHLLKDWNQTEKPTVALPPRKKEKKILIVDDSPSVRHVNSNLIQNAGWKTLIAKDGLEALEILQGLNELPDAILTDVEMPRMDGYELLASLKKLETLRAIPVIMITSRSSDKHRRKAFDLGADDYLTKPFEDAILLDKIKVLTRYAPENEQV